MIQGGEFASTGATAPSSVCIWYCGAVVCTFTVRTRRKNKAIARPTSASLCTLHARSDSVYGAEQHLCLACGAIVDVVVAATKALLILHFHRAEWLNIFFVQLCKLHSSNSEYIRTGEKNFLPKLSLLFMIQFKTAPDTLFSLQNCLSKRFFQFSLGKNSVFCTRVYTVMTELAANTSILFCAFNTDT